MKSNQLTRNFEIQSHVKGTLFYIYITNFLNKLIQLIVAAQTGPQLNCLLKMVSTRKKKGRSRRQFSRLGDTLNDFVNGNGDTVKTTESEALESQANGHHEDFEKIVDSASPNQVILSNTEDRLGNAVDSAVFAVGNLMYDAILTAMNNVVIPRIEMAVRSITGSSGNGPNSIVQKPDRRHFTGNTEYTPLRSASSRLDSNIEQDEIDETHEIDISDDGDFPATRIKYD